MERLISKVVALVVVLSLCLNISVANAYDYSGVGLSKQGVGSPILNADFAADDWNKWEMLVWGVFLSNFTKPLLDDYLSAFDSNSSRGSKGAGYKALQFGSGSDSENSKVIKSLLDVAITNQRGGAVKQVYVKHTDLLAGKVDGVAEDAGYREAKLSDLLFNSGGATDIDVSDVNGSINKGAKLVEGVPSDYLPIHTFKGAKVPTFAVKTVDSANYEVVFDYKDSYDLQIASSLICKALLDGVKLKQVKEIDTLVSTAGSVPVYLDCFGNLVAKHNGSYKVVIPASANKHLTNTPKINLLNSVILNGYLGSFSGETLMLEGQQGTWDAMGWLLSPVDKKVGGKTGRRGVADKSGTPAFASEIAKIKEGTPLIYYDLDSILYQQTLKGGVHYGKAVQELFNSDLSNFEANVPLKIEIANLKGKTLGNYSKDTITSIEKMQLASSMIPNYLGVNGGSDKAEILSKIKTKTKEVEVLGSPVIVAVQSNSGTSKGQVNNVGVSRLVPNFLYTVYTKGKVDTLLGTASKSEVVDLLDSSELGSSLKLDFFRSDLGANFVGYNTELFTVTGKLGEVKSELEGYKTGESFSLLGGKQGKIVCKYDGTAKGEVSSFKRLVKVYPVSSTMLNISSLLGLRDGTDFAQWSTLLYLTYLDFYGLEKGTSELGIGGTSSFNSRIFDGNSDVLSVDIQKVSNVKTKAEKKQDILNYTHMLLSPGEGSQYRTELLLSGFTGWVYKQYNNIVYGNSEEYYGNVYSKIGTRSETGFLDIKGYSENPFTAWFMRFYAKLAVWTLVLFAVGAVIIGIMRGKKLSWFFMSLFLITNSLLIVPTVADIVPNVANNRVSSMFASKGEYWGLAETVKNLSLEDKVLNAISKDERLSAEEVALVGELTKTLGVNYLDRAIVIKNDVSRKVTESGVGNYKQIQKYKSARWLLPLIVRQFNSNVTDKYIYLPLGDFYDDASNLYWLYEPADALTVSSYAAQNTESKEVDKSVALSNAKGHYSGFEGADRYINAKWSSLAYYTNPEGLVLVPKPKEELVHTYSYILPKGYQDIVVSKSSDLSKLKDGLGVNKEGYKKLANKLELVAGTYDRYDRSSMEEVFGYLWATENPGYRMYQVVKESFDSSSTPANILMSVQGNYRSIDVDREVREGLLYGKKGGTRDVLDLEGMFRNEIPYLYRVHLGAISSLRGEKINLYELYKGKQDKEWLFRSMWVSKLMKQGKKETVRNAIGEKFSVADSAIPMFYPASRPMVFSEAQQQEYGLLDSDLSVMELKCIEANKKTVRKWENLLNYGSMPDLSREALLRQMAITGTLAFTGEFSRGSGLYSGLYPRSLDLRAVSYDSVMRLLILNASQDSVYASGDLVETLIKNSDSFTAGMLLFTAFMNCKVVPLVRDITLAGIFYLGFLAVVAALFSRRSSKFNVTIGYILSNVLFLILTLVYYSAFALMLKLTTSDEVLSIDSFAAAGISLGQVSSILLLCVLSVLYTVGLVLLFRVCFKNAKDMGFGFYAEIGANIGAVVTNQFTKFGDEVLKWSGATVGKKDGKNGSAKDGEKAQNNKGEGSKEGESKKGGKGKGIGSGLQDVELVVNLQSQKIGESKVDKGSASNIDKKIEEGSQVLRGNMQVQSKERKEVDKQGK